MESDGQEIITIVAGLPRSGTSMVMRMLDAGGLPLLQDGSRTPDADNPHGYFELEAVKTTRQHPEWLDRAEGKAVKMIHLLLRDLPVGRRYRVVFMHRNLGEVLRSQKAMLDRQGRKAANLPDASIKAVYQQQIADALAFLRRTPGFELLEMQHADVIRDPHGQAQRLNTFLGGMLDASKMSAAVDPSLYRQRSGN